MSDSTMGGGMSVPVPLKDEDWETIIPLLDQVLLRPDEPKKKTKGGIILPDGVAIPVFRGQVLACSYLLHSTYESLNTPEIHRVQPGDRVIFQWQGAMPNDIEKEHPNILVSISNIIAKIKKDKSNASNRPIDLVVNGKPNGG